MNISGSLSSPKCNEQNENWTLDCTLNDKYILLDSLFLSLFFNLYFEPYGCNIRFLTPCDNIAISTELVVSNTTRRYTVLLFIGAVEYRVIPETALQIRLCRRRAREYQLSCIYKSFYRYIFTHGWRRGFFKNTAKMRLTYIKSVTYIIKCNILGKMTANIAYYPAIKGFIYFRFGYRAESKRYFV